MLPLEEKESLAEGELNSRAFFLSDVIELPRRIKVRRILYPTQLRFLF